MTAAASLSRPAAAEPAPRRGRPTAARVAEIEAAILRAARDAFLEHGYAAAGMDAIAAAAGVSKGTLYARHACKEDLFRAVVAAELERFGTESGAIDAERPSGLRPRLRSHAGSLVAMMARDEFRRFGRVIDGALAEFPEFGPAWHELANAKYARFMAGVIEHEAQGAPADFPFLASLFMHGLGSWLQTEALLRTVPQAEIEAQCDKVVEAIATLVEAAAARAAPAAG